MNKFHELLTLETAQRTAATYFPPVRSAALSVLLIKSQIKEVLVTPILTKDHHPSLNNVYNIGTFSSSFNEI